MSGENVDFVVGLIAIDSLSDERSNHRAHVDCGATLGEFLIHLASDGVQACGTLETSGLGCLPPRANRLTGQTQLSAKLVNLAAELELAVAQVRRKIAAALESAA
ncbi:MAG: hypothetical protein HY288_00080 [Planctomycetia bacterium]|nr:hypothetical protein [Planctomycetia bacterium]